MSSVVWGIHNVTRIFCECLQQALLWISDQAHVTHNIEIAQKRWGNIL